MVELEEALGLMLKSINLEGMTLFNGELCGDKWTVPLPVPNISSFHFVGPEPCWLHYPDERPPKSLAGDDVVFMPNNFPHTLAADRSEMSVEFFAGDRQCAEGRHTTLTCGAITYGGNSQKWLLGSLPELVVITKEEQEQWPSLKMMKSMLRAELGEAPSGANIIIHRLAELLFIQILRVCMDRDEFEIGLFSAITDPKIGRALYGFHKAPEEKWTVERLAQEANMSRSQFIQRFSEKCGTTPNQYVVEWRMQLAYVQLEGDQYTLQQIAMNCGYDHPESFHRAFKRYFDKTPGEIRRTLTDSKVA